MRLMQGFTSSAPAQQQQADKSTMDHTMLPTSSTLEPSPSDPYLAMRMPLLPDNFLTSHPPESLAADSALPMPEISIVAAHPETVVAAPLSEIEGMTMDGVELKFAHEGPGQTEREQQGMLTNLWNGLVEDVFGGSGNANSSSGGQGKGKVAM
jgi:hypothetical protein